MPFVLVTNTTSQSRNEIAGRLVDAGFGVDADEILTTVALTARYLRSRYPGASVELLNSGDITGDLVGVEVVEHGGDVIVVGGAGPEFSYENVNRLFARIEAGAPLVAMNPNLVWRTTSGLQLDAGAFVVALEAAAGVSAEITGKPSAAFFLSALEQVHGSAASAYMVGDDLRTDILGAQACGIRGVLVRTGKFRTSVLAESPEQPHRILDSFADLPAILDAPP